MADAREIVTDALLELGVIAALETPSNADAQFGLRTLNRQIDKYAAEDLLLYREARTTWTIAASTASYTVGTSGTIAVARPAKAKDLRAAYYTTADSTPTEIPLGNLTTQQRDMLPQKTATGSAPSLFYYDQTMGGTTGTGTLYLYPIPDESGLTGVLYSPVQVTEFASLSTTVLLPSGWREMLVKNLAKEMAPAFERTVSQDLREAAIESKAIVKRSNIRPVELRSEATAVLGGACDFYDIYRG